MVAWGACAVMLARMRGRHEYGCTKHRVYELEGAACGREADHDDWGSPSARG